MKKTKVLILGFGTVGRGVSEALGGNSGFEIAGVASSKGAITEPGALSASELARLASPAKGLSDSPAFKAFDSKNDSLWLCENAEYDALVELAPTNLVDAEPSLSHMKAALSRGKSVVTANKGPIALHYYELKALAGENNALLRFEATVGGAIPVFSAARGLYGDEIQSINGILNGTTNYILSRMESEKLPFNVALKEAQELGYAERDPTSDVEGGDAAAKITILANAIMDLHVHFKDVRKTGISRVTPELIEFALQEKKRVKLIASAFRDEHGVARAEVAPKLVPNENPLSSISGTLNAITLECTLAGPLTFAGKGAGKNPTASAVLNDLAEIGKALENKK